MSTLLAEKSITKSLQFVSVKSANGGVTNEGWTFFLTTFGCKVNQYETQAVREAWLRQHGCETDDPTQADIAVINTCAVTAEAVADARQAVRRLHRIAPNLRIVLTGCAAEAAQAELRPLPGVLAVLTRTQKDRLLNPENFLTQRGVAESEDEAMADMQGMVGQSAKQMPNGNTFLPFAISTFRRSRPVLKIQDGCSRRCTYCIVPLTRGPAVSRPARECLAEVKRLLNAGYREIIISGINLDQYRNPDTQGGTDFWDFISWLDQNLAPEWDGVARFRISSVYPSQLDEKGLDCLGKANLICPHLHLSLQSGSPEILRAMGRNPYAPEYLADQVRQYVQHSAGGRVGLGADILTGFPGETEKNFAETLDLLRLLPLTYAHVFPFSSRPGTRAATMPNQVPPHTRRERAAKVRQLADEKRKAFWLDTLHTPILHVAPEGMGIEGIDECHVPCHFKSRPNTLIDSPYSLIWVRPVSLEKKGLIVEPT